MNNIVKHNRFGYGNITDILIVIIGFSIKRSKINEIKYVKFTLHLILQTNSNKMNPSFLLPNRFKKIGYILFPFGLIIWISIQRGLFNTDLNPSLKVITLTLSFFSFLFGLYFTTFSKEPIEDEYINSVRLKSFQISSITQMVFFLISFIIMFLFNIEPSGDGGLSIFLLSSILIFWLMYMVIFNYTLITNKSKLDD